MQRLAFPLTPDPPIESGESGAVPMGCLCHLMTLEAGKGWQTRLGLGAESRILLFSTEGATDPGSYRQVIRHLPDNAPAGD
jgi:diaminopropionate ammonia-lyase